MTAYEVPPCILKHPSHLYTKLFKLLKPPKLLKLFKSLHLGTFLPMTQGVTAVLLQLIHMKVPGWFLCRWYDLRRFESPPGVRRATTTMRLIGRQNDSGI